MDIPIIAQVVCTGTIFYILGYYGGRKAGFMKYTQLVTTVTIDKLIEGGYIKSRKLPDGSVDIIKLDESN
jgi:DNA-binding MarR family transcriptional regulator